MLGLTAIVLMMGLGLVVLIDNDSDPQEDVAEPDERPVRDLTDGADTLQLEAADQVDGGQIINGGAGDDFILLADGISDTQINGQAGDDRLVIGDNNVADGGAGDDNLFVRGIDAVGYGGEGDDTVRISFDGEGTVYGGDGDDELSMVGGFGELNGDTGDDRFIINGLGTANGGAGDDIFTVVPDIGVSAQELDTHGPAELTGGAGADVFGIRGILGVNQDLTVSDSVNITDYAPGEDLLVFEWPSRASFDDDFNIRVTQNATTETTLVEFIRNGVRIGAAALAGMPDITASDIGIVTDIAGFEDAGPGANYDQVIGTFGNDTIDGVAGDTIVGGNGDDVIGIAETNGLASSISSGNGDDIITAGGGGILGVDAGAGDDEITVAAGGSVTITAGEGNDVINIVQEPQGGDAAEAPDRYVVQGGAGNDIINVVDVTGANVSLGDGIDVANIGEGTSVQANGAGADTVNMQISSALADFSDLGTYLTSGDADGIPTSQVRGSQDADTININVLNAEGGSFHIFSSYYSEDQPPDQPFDAVFFDMLVWSPDVDANINDLDLRGGDLENAGFNILTVYETGYLTLQDGQSVDVDTPIPAGPTVNINVTLASVSAELVETGYPFYL